MYYLTQQLLITFMGAILIKLAVDFYVYFKKKYFLNPDLFKKNLIFSEAYKKKSILNLACRFNSI